MKEITRIHIAKVAYDIEIGAKKELESYIAALERYAGDKELLGDIEIRITELLAERGVQADGVIALDDVAAVRAQLGEPSDFAPEGQEASREPSDEPRRVYRDTDTAVLGGVLAGFGRFFGIDPLWVRLVFIVLLFASFGTALVVYFILWLIIPPAETAAEKLRMNGRPVTLTSIKELSEKAEPAINETTLVMRRVLRVGTGIVLILGSLAALAAVAVVAAQIFLGSSYGPVFTDMPSNEGRWLIAVFACFAAAGLLLSALGMVLANATLRGVWNKRTGTAVVAIIAAGLIAFAGGVGATIYGRYDIQTQVDENRRTSYVNLPANFTNIKKLTVQNNDGTTDGVSVDVVYIVSDKPRYELDTFTNVKPEFVLADDSLSATVRVIDAEGDAMHWGYFGNTELRVYGPALEHVEVEENAPSVRYSTNQPQVTLDVQSKGTTSIELHGAYDAVTLASEGGGAIDMTQAAIKSLTIDNKGGLVEAGVVRTLTVTEPDACRAASTPGEPNIMVRVQAVSSGKMTYNGALQPAKTVANDCGKVVIGDENDKEGL